MRVVLVDETFEKATLEVRITLWGGGGLTCHLFRSTKMIQAMPTVNYSYKIGSTFTLNYSLIKPRSTKHLLPQNVCFAEECKAATCCGKMSHTHHCLSPLKDGWTRPGNRDNLQFTSHSFFLAGSPERARNTGSKASAPRAAATNGL